VLTNGAKLKPSTKFVGNLIEIFNKCGAEKRKRENISGKTRKKDSATQREKGKISTATNKFGN